MKRKPSLYFARAGTKINYLDLSVRKSVAYNVARMFSEGGSARGAAVGKS